MVALSLYHVHLKPNYLIHSGCANGRETNKQTNKNNTDRSGNDDEGTHKEQITTTVD